jgi:mono/diheme cytochrome c family protein
MRRNLTLAVCATALALAGASPLTRVGRAPSSDPLPPPVSSADVAIRYSGDKYKDEVIHFSDHGSPKGAFTKSQLLQSLKPVEKTVYELHEGGPASYGTAPFGDVLDLAFGSKAWRSGQVLHFTCLDGYEPLVPVAMLNDPRALVAFYRVGNPHFDLLQRFKGYKLEPLGPIYQTWDLSTEADIVEGKRSIPYQIVGIEVVDADYAIPPVPKEGSSERADYLARGQKAFVSHCLKCHSVAGKGGKEGPELPAAAAGFQGRDGVLKELILDPQGYAKAGGYPTNMEALVTSRDEGTADAVASQIIAYLQWLQTQK